MRRSLETSRIEHLPRALRSRLALVVDVGSNMGQWILALRRFAAVERLEAFEPNPAAFEVLSARLGAQPESHLHQLALGECPGVLTLHVTCSTDFSSLLPPLQSLEVHYSRQETAVVSEVPVPVTTLDAVLPSAAVVDLLKIDVQGFERCVLRGGAVTLKRTRILLIEMNLVPHYQGDDTFASLYDLITRELGFAFWDMSPPFRGHDGRALWTDAVFVNPVMCQRDRAVTYAL
jgi:FkbM family methyltransferase